MTERTGLLLSCLGAASQIALAVALVPACVPQPEPTEVRVAPSGGGSCPACLHELLRAEVVCDSCGRPMRHELRENRGAR